MELFAYSDFDRSVQGVQTKLYRLGIQVRHVVTKAPSIELRKNASDIEMSLDIQAAIYEDPNIDHYLLITGDGDFHHVIQRLRLKGKTVYLIAFERVNKHLVELSDHISIFKEDAVFLKKITDSEREKWAKNLISDKSIGLLLFHLDQMEKDKNKDFVGFSYFHKVITSKFGLQMDDALTQAKKAGLIITNSVNNPKDPKNPTSTIEINKESEIAKEILLNISNQ